MENININVSELLKKMLAAAESVIKKEWPDSKDYAESEFKKIGESIMFIQKEVKAGKMTADRARLHMEIQKNAARTALLALEGLAVIAVEKAINAALAAVKDTVNAALKFPLL